MIEKMIIDADLCIKLGASPKYRFLYDVLPLVSRKIYMHTWARCEVMCPPSAVSQLDNLVNEGKVELVNESGLDARNRSIFDATYRNLEQVMMNPHKPNKNKGELYSLAYAKTASIPFFATDEMNLQSIIDSRLNIGIDKITCIRIIDIVKMAHDNEINISRKICRALWVIAGKKKDHFDNDVWPRQGE